MPMYCYTSEDGQTIERKFSMNKVPRTVTVGDRVFHHDIIAEQAGRRDICTNWPKKCDGTGVLPSQTREASEHLASQGVPTEFAPDGRAILRTRDHRNKVLEVLQMHDKDAGYGDRAKP